MGVIGVQRGGRRGELRAIARISNVDASGIERADPHGLRVRLTAPAGREDDDDE